MGRRWLLLNLKSIRFLTLLLLISSLLFIQSVYALEISFFNTNIKEALNLISLDSNKTILYEPNISGSVTIQAENVDFEKALDLILMPYNYYWTKVGDIYFVGIANPNSPAFANASLLYQIPLKYLSSNDVRTLLPKVFQDYTLAPSSPDKLLIYAPVPIASQIAQIVSQIDAMQNKRKIIIKVVDVSDSFLRSLSLDFFGISTTSQVYPDLVQIPIAGTYINLLFSGKSGTESFEIVYEGSIIASNNMPFKINVQKVMNVPQYSDGKFSIAANVSYIEIQITPRFLHSKCLVDLNLSMTNMPSSSDFTLNQKGSTLITSTEVSYGKIESLASFSYDKVVEKVGGVSFLKDIPIIGGFFRNYNYEIEKRYMIFLISVEGE